MTKKLRLALILSGTLAAAACAPLPPPEPLPLVAYPGANKTPQALQEDDTACRGQAEATPAAAPAAPAPAASPTTSAATAAVGPPAQHEVYLQCMEARGNRIGAAPALLAARYAAYYPSYVYGPYSPGLWADPLWFGYYGSPTYLWGGVGFYGGGFYRRGFYGPGIYRGGYYRGGPGGFRGPGGPGWGGGFRGHGGPGGFRGRH